MRLVIDTEANRLDNPDQLWCICAKNPDTGEKYVFRRPDIDHDQRVLLVRLFESCSCFIGHNILGWDLHVLRTYFSRITTLTPDRCVDTLVVSRILDFDIDGGHGLEAWGDRLGVAKPPITDWSVYSEDIVHRCQEDVEINYLLFKKFQPYIESKIWSSCWKVEHFKAWEMTKVHENGFGFDVKAARELREKIAKETEELENEFQTCFPPRLVRHSEIFPRLTRFGTLNKSQFRWAGDDLSEFNGGPFTRLALEEFNPGSVTQRIDRLAAAGWKPTERSKGHTDFIRSRVKDPERLARFRKYGWKTSEENLATLPRDAPEGARKLARWLILNSKISDLDEWIGCAKQSSWDKDHYRIHANILPTGAWTGRAAHREPNSANIATEKPQDTPEIIEINRAMRKLWTCHPDNLLVGVDADQIQLRILCHYMLQVLNDESSQQFKEALLNGDKSKGTDVHSLNARALGEVCKGRRDSKTFIYAWILNAGLSRVAEILGSNREQASDANRNFLGFYPGLKLLREGKVVEDAEKGYFQGLDGRYVPIKGEDIDSRRHHTIAGWLQNGEAQIMSYAKQLWIPRLRKERIPFMLVNWVHDEWQTELPPDPDTARYVMEVQAESIKLAGERLGTLCPMKGSIYGGHDQLAMGKNWYETH